MKREQCAGNETKTLKSLIIIIWNVFDNIINRTVENPTKIIESYR